MLHDSRIDPGIYNQQADQIENHAMIVIHVCDDELSPIQDLETVNKKGGSRHSEEAQLELHSLHCELEVAIDEHLELLRENKALKEIVFEKSAAEINMEYRDLCLEHESLLADTTRKRKEIKACKKIIQILQGEITQTTAIHGVVDLTRYPDW